MPSSACASPPRRGHQTICIPCSQPASERAVHDPEEFRKLLDQRIAPPPEVFPPAIGRGDRMKDTSPSCTTGPKLRRIDRRDRPCSLVRPAFLRPDRGGDAADVPAPLCSARSPGPAGP